MMSVMGLTGADLLDLAADRLDDVPWFGGTHHDELCMVPDAECAFLSMNWVFYAGEFEQEAYSEAGRALRSRIGNTIARWNDSDGQTKENVQATMREAAAGLRASY